MTATLDQTGCFSAQTPGEGCIDTYCGVMFPVTAPEPSHIRIRDIGHALSNVCRFGGHCRSFYSVAQHSVHVMDFLRRAYECPEIEICGLLHDGSEAYLADICRPVKPFLTNYAALEAALQAAIWNRYGLAEAAAKWYPKIKWADNAVLRAEAESLIPSRAAGWNWGTVEAAEIEIEPWEPRRAEVEFEDAFLRLANELNIDAR